MDLSQNEAEEALRLVRKTEIQTRRSIAKSGAFIFLLITGLVWLVGFLGMQFLPKYAVIIWVGASVLGSIVSIFMGIKTKTPVSEPSASASIKKALFFWVCLILFCCAVIAIVSPLDGKQVTMVIFMFVLVGQLSMGFLLSFRSTWWSLVIAALVLFGYFFFSSIYYLWMGALVGGSMILLALIIHRRW